MATELQEKPRPANPPASFTLHAAIVVALVAPLLLLAVVAIVPRRHIEWIDPVTGSTKEQTVCFGLAGGETAGRGLATWGSTQFSAIEIWLSRCQRPHVNNWVFLSAKNETLLGVCYQCAGTPAIYPLRTGTLNDSFVRNSSDEEINDFVQIMQSGTEDEKQQAVQAAVEKALPKPPTQAASPASADAAPGDT